MKKEILLCYNIYMKPPFVDQNIKEVFKNITPGHLQAFSKLNIKTIKDLLYNFPTRYGDAFKATYIKDVGPEMKAVIERTAKNYPMYAEWYRNS